ncbi:hypothetical protein [Clostridium sp.]|uniref:hypothetical protein n=1 Tax=Clostridium sp. TaxID=1506 RepID=UPI0028454263|nr:hypothetical protein [Clostridium sp.]MDR3596029.1 hypothetical protein [Clostridium sp.]
MSLLNIINIEMYKISKRSMKNFIFATCILPAFYGISIYFKFSFVQVSSNNNTLMTCLDFVNIMWCLMFLLGLPFFGFLFLSINNVSSEIETGQIKLQLLHICNRKKLLYAKFLAVAAVFIVYFIAYNLISILVFYIFIANSEIGSKIFFSLDTATILISMLFYSLEILIFVAGCILLGLYFKPFIVCVSSVAFFLVIQLLSYIPYLKYISPSYMVDQKIYLQASNPVLLVFINLLITAIYLITILKRAEKRFKKMDVS